ncbi:hypothetical protein BN381_130316 [Candidatus Microthrix parvicella RN1]|uniref:Uncharacterized protein n=1 Tax=Candidatus Neomicrothrix parvicella RN1 TaxID=1229780 RepID=R4YX79_9ACTN|nr:hypothetical protein BN381_130316 [Candidatus Microthrix parvicella RN1]
MADVLAGPMVTACRTAAADDPLGAEPPRSSERLGHWVTTTEPMADG